MLGFLLKILQPKKRWEENIWNKLTKHWSLLMLGDGFIGGSSPCHLFSFYVCLKLIFRASAVPGTSNLQSQRPRHLKSGQHDPATREGQACTGSAMAKVPAVAASPFEPWLCHRSQLALLQTQAGKAVASRPNTGHSRADKGVWKVGSRGHRKGRSSHNIITETMTALVITPIQR